jgi:Pyridoxamine 5'-phosphate oxidase
MDVSLRTVDDPIPGAPRMPPSYSATGTGKASWSAVAEKLERARNYWLCSTTPGGRPHAVPVWALWFDGALWFSTDPASAKARNIARDSRVSVHLESGDDVVRLDGEAARAEWPDAVLDAYEKKYGHRIDVSNENYGTYVVRPRIAQTWDDLKNAVRWTFG